MIRRQDLMTGNEVAEIACVSEHFVRLLVAQDKLIAIKAGGALLFDANYAVRVLPFIKLGASLSQPRRMSA